MKISEATPHLISKWLERPIDKRTENDILIFYGELEKQNSPFLSFKSSSDKYQMLKTILRNHIKA